MKFLANENFSVPSLLFLRSKGLDVLSIAESFPGISDVQVMDIAIRQKRTILTHDSDYGELIFKEDHRPPEGVVYFRLPSFEPEEPGRIFYDLLTGKPDFNNSIIVIDPTTVRRRTY